MAQEEKTSKQIVVEDSVKLPCPLHGSEYLCRYCDNGGSSKKPLFTLVQYPNPDKYKPTQAEIEDEIEDLSLRDRS